MTIDLNTSIRQARMERTAGVLNPKDPNGEPEGEVYRPQDLVGLHASLLLLTKQIGDFLERTYPGWLWGVSPNQTGGVITILSGRLHPNYGLTIHIADVQSDPELRVVKQFTGQLLERFGMPRKAFWHCLNEYAQAPRNVMGHLIPDLADKRNNQLMLREKLEQGRYLRIPNGLRR